MPEPVHMKVGEAVFKVILPTRWHKPYHMDWQSQLGSMVKVTDGKADMTNINPADMMARQLEAFVKHCIVEMPEGATPEALLGEYYPAAEALFNEAKKLADEAEEAAERAVGKSKPTSSGPSDGEESSTSTTSSKAKGG
jgi:hypothetical protein